MAIPVLAEAIQGIRTFIDLLPSQLKLLMFLAILLGGVVISIPLVNLSFFEVIDFVVAGIGGALGFDWTIKGFVVLVFLGVVTFFALKYGKA